MIRVASRSRKTRSWVTKIRVRAVADQELLEPSDRLDVEVVRRLVEQQDVGLGDERPGQQDPAFHPRRQVVEPRVGVEAHPREDRVDPMGVPFRIVKSLGRDLGDRADPADGHVLCQPGDPKPLLADDLSLVGLDLARDQSEERALPLSVPPEEADSLAPLDLDFDPIQNLRPPKARLTSRRLSNAHEWSRSLPHAQTTASKPIPGRSVIAYQTRP